MLNFEYILIDVARYTEEDLLSISNTIGSVFLLDQIEDQQQLIQRLQKLLHVIQHMPEENQQKFITWMSNIMLHKLPEQEQGLQLWLESMKGDVTTMGLEKVLDQIERKGMEKGMEKGMVKGIEKGLLEGKEAVAKELINMGLDVTSIRQATGFTLEKIEQLRAQVK